MIHGCISPAAETWTPFFFARSASLQQVVFVEIIGSYACIPQNLCIARVAFAQRRAFRGIRVCTTRCTRRIRPVLVLSRRTLFTRAAVGTRETWHALTALDRGARHGRHCTARTSAAKSRPRDVLVRPGCTLDTSNTVRSNVPRVARAIPQQRAASATRVRLPRTTCARLRTEPVLVRPPRAFGARPAVGPGESRDARADRHSRDGRLVLRAGRARLDPRQRLERARRTSHARPCVHHVECQGRVLELRVADVADAARHVRGSRRRVPHPGAVRARRRPAHVLVLAGDAGDAHLACLACIPRSTAA